MLKSVPMGQSVDVVLRRGYPMLYNPDGCPKQSLEPVGGLSVPAGTFALATLRLAPQSSSNAATTPSASQGSTPLTYSRTPEADAGAPARISKLPHVRFSGKYSAFFETKATPGAQRGSLEFCED